MKQRIQVFTLGVKDLKRSMEFYQALGWQTDGIVGTEYERGSAVFFELPHGMKLALYEQQNLAWDSNAAEAPPAATEFSIGYFVADEAAVDAALAEAKNAGATLLKPGQKTFWGGYGGYFQDPDGHLWEVAHMKGMPLD